MKSATIFAALSIALLAGLAGATSPHRRARAASRIRAAPHRGEAGMVPWTAQCRGGSDRYDGNGGYYGDGAGNGRQGQYDAPYGNGGGDRYGDGDRYGHGADRYGGDGGDYYGGDGGDYYGGDDTHGGGGPERDGARDGRRRDGRGRPESPPPSPSPAAGAAAALKKLPAVGSRRLGLALAGSGVAATALGLALFFNAFWIRLGNILIIAGFPMVVGAGRTAGYFLQPKKARATGCVAAGACLVFIGWPFCGIVLEAFGVLNLFGNMFPFVMAMARTLPFVGDLIPSPSRKKKTSRRRPQEYDQEERDREEVEMYY